MSEPEIAGGNILVFAKIRDPEARVRLRQLLDDLPVERVNALIYEVGTEDWDEGDWKKEVERMEEIVDLAVDTLIFWQVLDGKLVRTCVAGRFA